MKEQINRYARGTFEYEPLSAVTEPEMIIATVKKNCEQSEGSPGHAGAEESSDTGYAGSVKISEIIGREIKGLLFSTNKRVRLSTDRFIGMENTVGYLVDVQGLAAGDFVEGSIVAVTNGGEVEIPFEFQVIAGSYNSQIGEISNLFQLANLAKVNQNEALGIFSDRFFSDVFLNGDLGLGKLRDELILGTDIKTAMEEFLIAVHKKSQVGISLEREEISFDSLEGEMPVTVMINKSVWGHVSLQAEAEGDFIITDRTSYDEGDFIGGKLEYTFYLSDNGLHAGRNTGRIVFSTPYERKTLVVKVDNYAVNDGRLINMFEKRNIVTLMKTYLNFRLDRVNMEQWILTSRNALSELLKNDEDDPYCNLLMSQILISDNKMNEAKFYLECARDEAAAGRGNDEVLYCYYLYVSTLYNKDRAYAVETSQLVKDIYENGEHDWRILWILLYFDVEMSKNKSLKLLRIKEQFNRGMRSPALLLEACLILNEQPLLLRVLNDFEIHVLLYGCKEGIVEERLLEQAAGLALNCDGKQRLLFRLLTGMYRLSGNDEVLEAICGILIRNGMKGTRYIQWYEKGIERGIKVTRLFEYYLASRDREDTSPLPKLVLLYFGYNSELDRAQKAYLYANIIRNKDNNSQIYANYIPRIREFIGEELERGTADENTGIILSEFMKKDMIDSHNAKGTADVLFTYRIIVNNKNIKNVIIGHKELKAFEKYPVSDGCAYVRIYTSEPAVSFEDGFGRLYKDTVEYKLDRVFTNELMIKQLMPYMDGNLLLSLYFCEKSRAYKGKQLELIKLYGKLAEEERLVPQFRRQLISLVIDYYFDNYEDEELKRMLATQHGEGIFEHNPLLEAQRIKLIEILIIYGRYEDAYRLMEGVSFEGISPKRAMRLCTVMIKGHEAEVKPEDTLVGLAYYAFSKGKYDNTILRFLNSYYNGPTEYMYSIWAAAAEKGVDMYELEERLICQMLFSGNYTEKIHKVFHSYKDNGAGERIVEAYIAYGSYMYFVKEQPVEECVFEYIEAWLSAGRDVINICRLALLKYYSSCDSLDNDRIKTAHELIASMAQKGYVFASFLPLSRYFVLPYQIADKTAVEYRANPQNRVVLHYARHGTDEYTAVEMKHMCSGVFVKTFVLFCDDEYDYYITEETPKGVIKTPKSVLQCGLAGRNAAGRFGMLNNIIGRLAGNADEQEVQSAVRAYAALDNAVRDKFDIL